MKKVLLLMLVSVILLVADIQPIYSNIELIKVKYIDSGKVTGYSAYIKNNKYKCLPIPTQKTSFICVYQIPKTNLFSLLRAEPNKNQTYDFYLDIDHKVLNDSFKIGQTNIPLH